LINKIKAYEEPDAEGTGKDRVRKGGRALAIKNAGRTIKTEKNAKTKRN
jgi:hypothetical protein